MRGFLIAAITVFSFSIQAHAKELIWDTLRQQGYTLDEFVSQRQPGEILVFGEQHATRENEKDTSILRHHQSQVRLLERLTDIKKGAHINTGMEFLPYPQQGSADRFLEGTLLEDYFLKAVSWAYGTPFDLYRDQVLMPRRSGGRTLALNMPKEISKQVAKGGPSSLQETDRQLLPPIWERGSLAYFERFGETMGDHVTPEKLDNYFWAQSLWDDTMAWNATRYTDQDSYTVIIVGEFHVEFGHGLPSRLNRYGANHVTTLLQVDAPAEVSLQDIERLTAADAKYGQRADYIWLNLGP